MIVEVNKPVIILGYCSDSSADALKLNKMKTIPSVNAPKIFDNLWFSLVEYLESIITTHWSTKSPLFGQTSIQYVWEEALLLLGTIK